ncbi:receptor-type tyrosine-protein phosphatase mu [Caerostris extrusa]|uniref:protein-tyrosine-phosphatase n=1 Tax=Caerostris extrusa TaxID=172846 RepID=A0AAV4U6N9_CAEEX|nr:receptor-type tyrosine-protein phosphatase mu [Caerostris extrusa]
MYPCSVAKLPENDHSLVYLKTTNGSDYVHANFIDGYKDPHRYIATQGPMVNTVTDFWYMVWQEKVSKIIMIANVIETGKCKCENSPIVVHCSAGIGRTGTVILFENAFEMSIQENQIDVLGLLFSMRKQRMNIVENYDQYTFVYHALVEALCIENTCTNSVTFLKKYSDLIKPDEETGMTRIRKQFQMLNDLPVQLLPKDIFAAYTVSNQAKNRNMHILPNYINAVYIDSYRHKNMFVATEYPLPETVIDFLRMVFEVKSKIIILLQSIPFSNEDYPLFWPANPQEENSPVPIKLIHIKSWDVKTFFASGYFNYFNSDEVLECIQK